MRIPRIRPQRAAKLLERHGFRLVRSSGSHRIYRDAQNRRFVLAYHSRTELPLRTVKELMEILGLDADEL